MESMIELAIDRLKETIEQHSAKSRTRGGLTAAQQAEVERLIAKNAETNALIRETEKTVGESLDKLRRALCSPDRQQYSEMHELTAIMRLLSGVFTRALAGCPDPPKP